MGQYSRVLYESSIWFHSPSSKAFLELSEDAEVALHWGSAPVAGSEWQPIGRAWCVFIGSRSRITSCSYWPFSTSWHAQAPLGHWMLPQTKKTKESHRLQPASFVSIEDIKRWAQKRTNSYPFQLSFRKPELAANPPACRGKPVTIGRASKSNIPRHPSTCLETNFRPTPPPSTTWQRAWCCLDRPETERWNQIFTCVLLGTLPKPNSVHVHFV